MVFAKGEFFSVSTSNILTVPDDFVTKDPIMPIVEDLPAPLGPNKA